MPQGITSLRLAATSLCHYIKSDTTEKSQVEFRLGFFQLSVPQAEREVCFASEVRLRLVKCAFGTLCGTLNFTASKEQLHYAARHNFTAACRNFTIEIFTSV